MAATGTSVPNLTTGIDDILSRLKTQRAARANVDQLLSGGGRAAFGSGGSDAEKIVKVTQVASNSQKWAIVKYVIIGVLIIAGLGTILYFVFNTGPGQNLRAQVQNNLPLGDRSKPGAVEPAAANRTVAPNTSQPPLHSRGATPQPPPPPPIPSAVVNPYGGNPGYPHPPHTQPTQPAHPHTQPPAAYPQPSAPAPAPAPTPTPAPTPAPAPAPQPITLVPIEQQAPKPAPKPNIGNVGGLPGPI